MTVRAEVEVRAQEVRRMNAEADLLEAQVRAARERASATAKDASHTARDFEHTLKRREEAAVAEIRALNARLAQILASKSAPVRPVPEARGLARKFLHQGTAYVEVERLAAHDVRFAQLFGALTDAQQLTGRAFGADIRDEAIYAQIDELECKCWRAVVQRAKELAGEAI